MLVGDASYTADCAARNSDVNTCGTAARSGRSASGHGTSMI